jgi:rhamnosyltransferase
VTIDPRSGGGDAGSRSGVFIVLSSYNGVCYLAEQLESIRAQTYEDWTLLVRDDASSDATADIVESFANRDRRIVPLRDGRGNLGPAVSFGALLERAAETGARYIALADQDDVWQPHKLASELRVLWAREAEVGDTVPLLVHSDLTVVQRDLRLVHPSFLALQGLDREVASPLATLLVQNFVTGCTVVLNRALLRTALPLPRHVVMHDWWLALCAAAVGELLYLPEATLLYRQHDANAVGARGFRQALIDSLRRPWVWWRGSNLLLAAALQQACALARRLEDAGASPAHSSVQAMLREYCGTFAGAGALHRLRTVRRHHIVPHSAMSFPLFYYARVLLWPARLRALDPGRV